jgi:hypothetical protein
MSTTTAPTSRGGPTRLLGGITVGDTPLIRQAMEFARKHSDPYLYNHAVRSWLFAVRLGQFRQVAHDPEVVAVGTLLHDIGLTAAGSGPRRFEIEGADVARSFAQRRGLDGRRAQLIWDSVALNSTPSIGMYKEAEVALCTAGIGLDFGGSDYDRFPPNEMSAILAAFPRLGMKRAFTDAICRICIARPETTYDNFAGDFGERFVPGYRRPSAVDYLTNAPFEE